MHAAQNSDSKKQYDFMQTSGNLKCQDTEHQKEKEANNLNPQNQFTHFTKSQFI